jgi:hypothetical protein
MYLYVSNSGKPGTFPDFPVPTPLLHGSTYSTQSCLFLIKKTLHQLSKRLAGKCQFCSTVFEWRNACQNANWISSVPIAYMIKSERKPTDFGQVFFCFLINSVSFYKLVKAVLDVTKRYLLVIELYPVLTCKEKSLSIVSRYRIPICNTKGQFKVKSDQISVILTIKSRGNLKFIFRLNSRYLLFSVLIWLWRSLIVDFPDLCYISVNLSFSLRL